MKWNLGMLQSTSVVRGKVMFSVVSVPFTGDGWATWPGRGGAAARSGLAWSKNEGLWSLLPRNVNWRLPCSDGWESTPNLCISGHDSEYSKNDQPLTIFHVSSSKVLPSFPGKESQSNAGALATEISRVSTSALEKCRVQRWIQGISTLFNLLHKIHTQKLVSAPNNTCPINLGIRYRPFGDRAHTSE